MKSIFATHKLLSGIALVLFFGADLSGMIWLQSRYFELAAEKARLVREVSALRGEVISKELENSELASLSRIADMAQKMGLSYCEVPLKVLPLEEAR